jgi:putative transposase
VEGYAVKEPTTTQEDVIRFRRSLDQTLRERVRQAIEIVLEEELADALGAERYGRDDRRRGYRNGAVQRDVTTETGLQRLRIPRGRVLRKEGGREEFRSEALPRYARRTRRVDEAILGTYLAGGNSRRIRKALEPLLGDANLSKSAISRIVGRLKAQFADWSCRDLSSESYAILFLDGFHLKVRLARRVVSVPVLAVLGVGNDGTKHLVALQLAVSESGVAWRGLIEDLIARGLEEPRLLVTDGHEGLKKARAAWPDVPVQRCTQHKLRNLLRHCPKHAHRELKRDYDAIVYARDGKAAHDAYGRFVAKWTTLCPPAAKSLEEAGTDLLTFYAFPRSMYKGLRTTNSLENLNREFRRRTKTQGSFGTEEAAVTLLYGLVASGQIELRKITGHSHVASLVNKRNQQVA